MRGILMTVLLTALLFASIGCATAAPLQEVWNKTYGGAGDERINLVLQTDGGYLIAGRIKNFDECTTDVWLVKIDSNGNEEWNRTFEKTHTDWLNHILLTSDDAFIIVRINGSLPDYDKWIEKIDANGTVQWCRSLGAGLSEQVLFLMYKGPRTAVI